MAYEYNKHYNKPIVYGSEWSIDQGGNIVSFGEEIQGIVIPKIPLVYRNLTFNNVIDNEIKHFKPEVQIQEPPDDPDVFEVPNRPQPKIYSYPGHGVYSEGIVVYNFYHWMIYDWAKRGYAANNRNPNSAGKCCAMEGDYVMFRANFISHQDEEGNDVRVASNGIQKYEWFVDGKLAKVSEADDPYFDLDYKFLESSDQYGSKLPDL